MESLYHLVFQTNKLKKRRKYLGINVTKGCRVKALSAEIVPRPCVRRLSTRSPHADHTFSAISEPPAGFLTCWVPSVIRGHLQGPRTQEAVDEDPGADPPLLSAVEAVAGTRTGSPRLRLVRSLRRGPSPWGSRQLAALRQVGVCGRREAGPLPCSSERAGGLTARAEDADPREGDGVHRRGHHRQGPQKENGQTGLQQTEKPRASEAPTGGERGPVSLPATCSGGCWEHPPR